MSEFQPLPRMMFAIMHTNGDLRFARRSIDTPHEWESVLVENPRDCSVVFREQWTQPKGDDLWMVSRIICRRADGLRIDPLDLAELASDEPESSDKSIWKFSLRQDEEKWEEMYAGHRMLCHKIFLANWEELPWFRLGDIQGGLLGTCPS